MKLHSYCIVTDDVLSLSDFYCKLLGLETMNEPNKVFIQHRLPNGMLLDIYSVEHEKQMGGGSQVKTNRNLWMQFQVEDVDYEYERVKQMNVEIIEPPKLKPWGNYSFYFRDPDGNPISFFRRNENRD